MKPRKRARKPQAGKPGRRRSSLTRSAGGPRGPEGVLSKERTVRSTAAELLAKVQESAKLESSGDRDPRHEERRDKARRIARAKTGEVASEAITQLLRRDLQPEEARELIGAVLQSAVWDLQLELKHVLVLVDVAQRVAPEVFGALVTSLVRSGNFSFAVTEEGDYIGRAALALRMAIIEELKLTEAHELTQLDAAMGHWISARKALLAAQKAPDSKVWSRRTRIAQAADKLYAGILHGLRARHQQPHVAAVQIRSADRVAVQINEAGSPLEPGPARAALERE